ncbi:YddF family protein [Clostridium sp. C2-6-12]|uniref:YddF family protein n=1 Tax=Clostridium sp. C2-6-12 TaxID=2698832 RepID=UPI001FAD96F5|nr:YddF family protein [Clostridium sp. C2-6-12]
MSNNMKIGIFNGTIATTNGLYRISDITVDDAKKLVLENGFISAIGHEATAKCISDTFNINIPMNRIDFKQEIGQKAIVFKLNKRPPEGSILCRAEIDEIGYSFKLMERLE